MLRILRPGLQTVSGWEILRTIPPLPASAAAVLTRLSLSRGIEKPFSATVTDQLLGSVVLLSVLIFPHRRLECAVVNASLCIEWTYVPLPFR